MKVVPNFINIYNNKWLKIHNNNPSFKKLLLSQGFLKISDISKLNKNITFDKKFFISLKTSDEKKIDKFQLIKNELFIINDYIISEEWS